MKRVRSITTLGLAVCLVFAVSACGPSKHAPTSVSNGPDTGSGQADADAGPVDAGGDVPMTGDTSDGTIADAGDTGGDTVIGDTSGDTSADASMCGDATCSSDQVCQAGKCVKETACQHAQDLGTIGPSDSPMTLKDDPTGQPNRFHTTCTTTQGSQSVFKFTAGADAKIHLQLTSTTQPTVDWEMEVHEGACDSSGKRLLCSDPETTTFYVQQGKTYYLIVEPHMGTMVGPFKIDMTLTAVVCSPPGGKTCQGPDLGVCDAGQSVEKLTCGAACSVISTGAACGGDTCENPIVVTQSGTYKGDISAYNSDFNFKNDSTCKANAQDTPIASPGPDVVFKLPGLKSGQTVTVDASKDLNDNAIFILPKCDPTASCLKAVDLGDKLTWTVPKDGDYWVVVDKISFYSHPFTYSFTIQ